MYSKWRILNIRYFNYEFGGEYLNKIVIDVHNEFNKYRFYINLNLSKFQFI